MTGGEPGDDPRLTLHAMTPPGLPLSSSIDRARRSVMEKEVTQELARLAGARQYERISKGARAHTKNVLLDALACAIAGDRGEETPQVAALAAHLAQSREASVIGGDHLSLAGATLLNGYLVTAVTMCD